MQRAPRWSKKTDELVRFVAGGCRPALQAELGHWLEVRPRFAEFVSAHQDKIRKKLSAANDDSRLDVRAELLVAFAVLGDRRFAVAFEAYGAGRLGPDLTLTFRANQRLNLEVTRLRARADTSALEHDHAARVANVIAAKLRQLPSEIPNALVITSASSSLNEQTLAAATRLLRTHSESKDDAFFTRRGFTDARDFHVHHLRLGGVFALDESGVSFLPNREARHPLRVEISAALDVCLRDSV